MSFTLHKDVLLLWNESASSPQVKFFLFMLLLYSMCPMDYVQMFLSTADLFIISHVKEIKICR